MSNDKIPTISIDMDKRCSKCKQKGALPNGLCMRCVSKNIRAGKYDEELRRIRDKIKRG